MGVYTSSHCAPTFDAKYFSADRSSRPQTPKSSTTLVPASKALIASQMKRPSRTSRFPSASLWLKSGIIQSSGVSRMAANSAANSLARVVLPEPGRPTVTKSLLRWVSRSIAQSSREDGAVAPFPAAAGSRGLQCPDVHEQGHLCPPLPTAVPVRPRLVNDLDQQPRVVQGGGVVLQRVGPPAERHLQPVLADRVVDPYRLEVSRPNEESRIVARGPFTKIGQRMGDGEAEVTARTQNPC